MAFMTRLGYKTDDRCDDVMIEHGTIHHADTPVPGDCGVPSNGNLMDVRKHIIL